MMTRQQQSEYDAFPCELAKTPHTALTVTMPTNINDKLISWASEIDEETIRQAQKTARLPIIEGHVALMPDAHVGKGATVGSVIPTPSCGSRISTSRTSPRARRSSTRTSPTCSGPRSTRERTETR